MIPKINARTVSCTVSFSIAALLSAPAWAQADSSPPASPVAGTNAPPLVGASVNYGYVAPGTAKFQGQRLAKSAASSLDVGVDAHLALDEKWSLQLGLRSDNYFLEAVSGAPVPEDIHTLRLSAGLGYRINEQWAVMGILSPALYRFEDVNSDDFGVAGGVIATCSASPQWLWSFGILVSPDSDAPVVPVVGLRWLINDRYTLELGIPKTRLTYSLDSKWALYTGVDMSGTTFRAGENLGAKYNNALGTYRDIRLGVGATYNVWHALRAEVEAGYSVYRRIDYSDLDQHVSFHPAPYVRVGLSYGF